MRRIVILVVFAALFGSLPVWGQSCYWVAFTDKNNSSYSLSNPEEFLSERAIRRRENQNIAIDSLDLPVNSQYISKVLQRGATLLHSSKWLNGITVKTTNDNFVDNTLLLPFVKEVQLTKRPTGTKSAVNKFMEPEAPYQNLEIDTTLYGNSVYQVAQLNGQFLHNQNFRGQGKHIAVLDGGFSKTDQYPAFDSLWAGGQILGAKNLVDQEEGVFEGNHHGMSVLSVMGGNVPGHLIGTAPKASYWIIRTEDVYSEFLVEEDNWVVGAEFADSVGVDIINSSLGYCTFDDPGMDHSHSDMDGHTTRISKGANIAASRGILVFASAGNEGRQNNLWKYIITPSDGDSVLAIGAANKDGVPAPFTSPGPASDGDIKPNVSAVGWNTIIQRSNGEIGTGNGTSYSSPVVAGAAACLWQANPHASAAEVKRALEQSAHLYANPDSLLGYGIPDLKLANKILQTSIVEKWAGDATWLVYPNPANDYIVIQKNGNATLGKVQLAFYTLDGKLVRKEQKSDAIKIIIQDLQTLPRGLLLLQIISDDVTESVKIRKSP